MRYDAEYALTQTVKDYLLSVVCEATRTALPIVDFTDEMTYTDEAGRIVVLALNCVTTEADPANFTADVEVGIKSQWAQATLKDDIANHFSRVNEVRDKLMPRDLATRLQAKAPAGFVVEFVKPERKFSSSPKTENWIYSETGFSVRGYFSTQP